MFRGGHKSVWLRLGVNLDPYQQLNLKKKLDLRDRKEKKRCKLLTFQKIEVSSMPSTAFLPVRRNKHKTISEENDYLSKTIC